LRAIVCCAPVSSKKDVDARHKAGHDGREQS
jgi:hypothetical protein